MFKKCQSNCPADKYLWLRNNVFYYMVELPQKNGKRRYICKSLKTTNYYEAQERLKLMIRAMNRSKIETMQPIYKAQALLDQMTFYETEEMVEVGGQVMLQKVKRLDPDNDPAVVNEFFDAMSKVVKIKLQTLDEDDIEILKKLIADATAISEERMLETMYKVFPNTRAPGSEHTIEYIVNAMLKKLNLKKVVQDRKYKAIEKLLKGAGLKITDKYTDFYQKEIIAKIGDNISAMKIKNSGKLMYKSEIENLIKYANALDPDIYKTNLIHLLPNFTKTTKEDADERIPFTRDELKKIFDPNNDYFKNRPDVFWSAMVGLFVGARTNAAATLQYANIVNENGIDCIKFQRNHTVKALKTNASARIVPIPVQLLDMGFVDYINRQKAKLDANPEDFIFPKAITSGGNFNNKFTSRGFIQFIKTLGIQKDSKKQDFHSLRKNANQCLDDARVPGTYINEIIGWEGKDTREQYYSHHTLAEIKVQADKMRYDFLQPEFDAWAEYFRNN